MKRARYLYLLVIVFILSGLLFTACGPGTKDVTATSTAELQHSHKVTISGGDIDKAPNERIITTTKDGATPHTHLIRLTKREFEFLKQGVMVNLTSSPFEGDKHTHNFRIKKP